MKKIVITGCSSGFGYEAAKQLAEKGHYVYATMRNIQGKNAQPAMALSDYAKTNGLNIRTLEMNVTSDESIQKAFEQIPEIDVLINNAGSGFGGSIEMFTSQEILNQLDLNIVGTTRTAKAALPKMRAQKSGLIIQVSSVAGRCAFPGWGVYHASKWGLEGLSEAMRYELAPLGIDVVLVEPGPFSTNFFENMVEPANEELAEAYQHITEFGKGFEENVRSLFEDENAPTDPNVVVDIFEKLIDLPNGSRPLRTIAGLDFGFQGLNDATEPFRKSGLVAMGVAEWDGPKATLSEV